MKMLGDKISLTPGDFTTIVTTDDMNFFENFFICFAARNFYFSTYLTKTKYNNTILVPMQTQ
jgi:hypothetical protein